MLALLRQLINRPLFAFELLTISFFVNLLGLASSIYVIQVLNRYVSHGIDATLITLTSGVLLAVILEFFFRQLRSKLAQGVTVPPAYNLLLMVFAQIVSVRSSLLDRLSSGQRREIVSSPGVVARVYGPSTLATCLDLPFALMFVGALFLLQAEVAWVASVFILAAFLVSAVSYIPLKKPQKIQAQASSEAGAMAFSSMRRPDTSRAFNAQNLLRGRWKRQQTQVMDAGRLLEGRRVFFQSLTKTIASLMSIAVIGVGAKLTVAGEMDMGLMIGANILAARAIAPILAFAQLRPALSEAERAMELLKGFSKLAVERPGGRELANLDGGLAFNDLAFAHRGETHVLFESLSFTLQGGQSLLVVGGNGVGKTTLSRLLMGLLEPSRGQILLNGVNMDQVSLSWWRKQVAYLPQEPEFFDGTIRENLLSLNPHITEEQLAVVTAEAGLTHFLHNHPKGLDAPILNDGTNLAAGVRKRLALARALTSDKRIAIFDEPMEGMDGQGRSAVSKVLGAFINNGRSVVVFSHDISLVSGADMVLDLDSKPVPTLTYRTAKPSGVASP
ncbi:MAG: ATP-binding cassette domain-containing protein [Magnetococcales bacterium]|nr:ATP-binding cassette domain-containing protein [Magnetococcales bacterium]